MKTLARIALTLPLALAFAGRAPAAEIKLGTGETATATVLQYVVEPFEKATGHKINPLKVGSGKAFIELIKGGVEACTSDASLEELLAKAKKEGVDPGDASAYQVTTLAKFRIAAVVNKDNPVGALSKDQLRDLFSGKITNWKEVGGSDAPVLVVWNKFSEGANYLFTKAVLDKTPLTGEKMEVQLNEEVRNTVSTTPEAIGLLPVGMLNDSVKAPKIDDISKEILMVTKGKPSPAVEKLVAFTLEKLPR